MEQIKYSFVLMLKSLSSLATTSKLQKNICFKMTAVGLIGKKTKKNVKVVAIYESGLCSKNNRVEKLRRAKRACGAPWVRFFGNFIHARN